MPPQPQLQPEGYQVIRMDRAKSATRETTVSLPGRPPSPREHSACRRHSLLGGSAGSQASWKRYSQKLASNAKPVLHTVYCYTTTEIRNQPQGPLAFPTAPARTDSALLPSEPAGLAWGVSFPHYTTHCCSGTSPLALGSTSRRPFTCVIQLAAPCPAPLTSQPPPDPADPHRRSSITWFEPTCVNPI